MASSSVVSPNFFGRLRSAASASPRSGEQCLGEISPHVVGIRAPHGRVARAPSKRGIKSNWLHQATSLTKRAFLSTCADFAGAPCDRTRAGNGRAGFSMSGPTGRKANAPREYVIVRESGIFRQRGSSCDDHMIVMHSI
jgi:hypothetical protein